MSKLITIEDVRAKMAATVTHLGAALDVLKNVEPDDESISERVTQDIRSIEVAARRIFVLDGMLVETTDKVKCGHISHHDTQPVLSRILRYCETWLSVDVREADYE